MSTLKVTLTIKALERVLSKNNDNGKEDPSSYRSLVGALQ